MSQTRHRGGKGKKQKREYSINSPSTTLILNRPLSSRQEVAAQIQELKKTIKELEECLEILKNHSNKGSFWFYFKFYFNIFLALTWIGLIFGYAISARDIFLGAKKILQESASSLFPNQTCGNAYPYLNKFHFLMDNGRAEIAVSGIDQADATCFMLAKLLFEGPGMTSGYTWLMTVFLCVAGWAFLSELKKCCHPRDSYFDSHIQLADPQEKLKKANVKFNFFTQRVESGRPPALTLRHLKYDISQFEQTLEIQKEKQSRMVSELKSFLLAGYSSGSSVYNFMHASHYEPGLLHEIAAFLLPPSDSPTVESKEPLDPRSNRIYSF